MARQMIKGLMLVMLAVALSLVTAVVSVNGQSANRQVANIPFEFVVGSSDMPAGKYGVEAANTTGDALRIRGIDNSASALRLSNAIVKIKPAKKGMLVFHRYGNQYFLAEVWSEGETQGRQLLKSSREKATAIELAANAPRGEQKYERVEIALVRQ